MGHQVVVRLQMPDDLKQLRFPKALNRRLHDLLDKQNALGKLSRVEREEAEGLVEMAEIVSLLRLRTQRLDPKRSAS